MTREQAHKLVDELFDLSEKVTLGAVNEALETLEEIEEASKAPRELPKDKRVVRTKASGDRVYLLDEVKKTRQWCTNPDVLDSLGFTLNDVTEVDEEEMLKYQMAAALYRRVDEVA